MSLFTTAIDNYVTKNLGENGHAQFAHVSSESTVSPASLHLLTFQTPIFSA